MWNNRLLIPLLAVCLLALAACHDDDDDYPTGGTPWQAEVSEGDLLSAENHYNTVGITLSGDVPAGATITLSTDADWLTLDADTLPSDGLFDVLPEANERGTTRDATLTLTCLADGSQRQVVLTQEGDDGSNADNDWHIGQGFSCFDDYMSEASLRRSVISVARLQALDGLSGVVSVQDAVRGEEDMEVYTARSLVEMQSVLTKTTETKVNALFYKKTVKRFTKVSTHSTSEQCYSYARINRVVGSRTMDEGNLRYLLHNKELVSSGDLPFTDDFYKAYRNITGATNDATRARAIRDMLNTYGTHIVVQASLGGAIDLVACYQRDDVTTLTETAETVSRKVFGRSSSSSSSSSESSVSSSFSAQGAITISGGSKAARTALENRVKQLSTGGSLSGTELDNWISTITSSAMNDGNQRKNLGVVSFRFIPIWDVFADQTISREVMAQVVGMAEQEKNNFSDKELGFDNYRLPLTSALMDFSTSPDSTLVRLVYAKPSGSSEAVPIAEVCNEYVPTVRADRRITVVYPIVNGTTRITQGLFPGDGEGNRPAWLVFGGGDVYVNPIDGYGSTDHLDTIYYLHGSLYPTDMGVPLRNVQLTTQSHYLTLRYYSYYYYCYKYSPFYDVTYPVVKLGSIYWTRRNMHTTDAQQWSHESRSAGLKEFNYMLYVRVAGYDPRDVINTGLDVVLYRTYYNDMGFYGVNKAVYSYDERWNRLWYYPRRSDLTDLQQYVGGHLKSLFAGQQSGFEAQFVGYYAIYDVLSNDWFSDDHWGVRYNGEQCFVVAKDDYYSEEVTVLIISPDYTWRQVIDGNDDLSLYPVRLCRDPSFNYIRQSEKAAQDETP